LGHTQISGQRRDTATTTADTRDAIFRENDIHETVLPSLTHESLRELGVASFGHRVKLLFYMVADWYTLVVSTAPQASRILEEFQIARASVATSLRARQ
jgi:hypothetical protein